MKILHICTGWMNHEQWFTDNALADAAYAAIQAAMADYKEYSNDANKTVTFSTGEGGSLTLRVSQLVAASCDDLDQCEPNIIAREMWKRRLKAKLDAEPTVP